MARGAGLRLSGEDEVADAVGVPRTSGPVGAPCGSGAFLTPVSAALDRFDLHVVEDLAAQHVTNPEPGDRDRQDGGSAPHRDETKRLAHAVNYYLCLDMFCNIHYGARMASVLVVEDDQFVRSALIRHLTGRRHTVRSAGRALEALREVAQAAPTW